MGTEIRIPKSKKDLRIRHLKAFSEGMFSDNPTLSEKIIFLSDLTGVPLYEFRKLSEKNNNKLYRIASLSCSGFKMNDKPPQNITLNNKEFELIDPTKAPTGWHIDKSKTDAIKDPARMACLFYFPKGERYGDTDEHSNLVNPISDRYETIKEHLPLQVYLEASAFFLKQYERSMTLQVAKLRGQKFGKKLNRILRNTSGKNQLTP